MALQTTWRRHVFPLRGRLWPARRDETRLGTGSDRKDQGWGRHTRGTRPPEGRAGWAPCPTQAPGGSRHPPTPNTPHATATERARRTHGTPPAGPAGVPVPRRPPDRRTGVRRAARDCAAGWGAGAAESGGERAGRAADSQLPAVPPTPTPRADGRPPRVFKPPRRNALGTWTGRRARDNRNHHGASTTGPRPNAADRGNTAARRRSGTRTQGTLAPPHGRGRGEGREREVAGWEGGSGWLGATGPRRRGDRQGERGGNPVSAVNRPLPPGTRGGRSPRHTAAAPPRRASVRPPRLGLANPAPTSLPLSHSLSPPLPHTHTHARAGSEPRFSLSLAASEPATAPASPAPHGKGDAGTRARDRDPIGLGDHGAAATRSRVNDPSAGSPTETLLRLLLPLDSQVRPSSQRSARAVGRPRRGRSEGLTKPSNR